MTPKEKAFELFDKYMQPIDELHKYPMCFATAKQCALIAVDEILQFDNKIHWSYTHDELIEKTKTIKFWAEVKQQIEKI